MLLEARGTTVERPDGSGSGKDRRPRGRSDLTGLPAEVCALVELTDPERDADTLAAALDRVQDWDALLRHAERHKVSSLVAAVLSDAAHRDRLPASRREEVKALARRAYVWDSLQVRALGEIIDGFGRAEIPFLVLKGLGLAERLYPRPIERSSTDIDILVPRGLLPRARERLQELGYRAYREAYYERRHFHVPLLRPYGGILTSVELHWDVTPLDSPVRFDVQDWFERPRAHTLRSGRVLLPPELEELRYLAYHAFVEGTLVIRDLGDVRRVLDRLPGATPAVTGRGGDATTCVAECAALAARIWGETGREVRWPVSARRLPRRWLARHLLDAPACLLDGPGRWWAFRAVTRWALLDARQADIRELWRDRWMLDDPRRRRGRSRRTLGLALAALLCCLPRWLFPSGFRQG